MKSDNVCLKERTRSSYSEGFEPRKGDPSAHFDNTPPTTPEHDEAECVPSAHQKDCCNASDISSKTDLSKPVCPSTSSSSSISLPSSSSNAAQSKSASESPSDNDMTSTASTDNLDATTTAQHSESSGAEQEFAVVKKRKRQDEMNTSASAPPKKKKRIHGTRSRTARKSPKCKF